MAARPRLAGGVSMAGCWLRGREGIDLLGIVDSGAPVTHAATEARRRARLEPTGKSRAFMCVHGQNHAGIATSSYRGKVTLGARSGTETVYEIDARLVVGGRSVGAVLGRDVLQNFDVGLNWRSGTGFLEG